MSLTVTFLMQLGISNDVSQLIQLDKRIKQVLVSGSW